MLARLLGRAVFSALGLWLASAIVPGVDFADTGSLVLAVILLGIANAVLRPVLFLFTLPLTVLSLGLFLLVLNAAMIGLVAWVLPGFTISGFVAGVLCVIVTGVLSWIGQMVLREPERA